MIRQTFLWCALFCFGAVVSLPTAGFAQSQANTGTIEGTVADPSGRTLANAAVTITNIGTNFSRDIQTDNEGRFRGLLLPLGGYRVTVKAPGFGTTIREGMDLAVGQSMRKDVAISYWPRTVILTSV